MESIQLSIVGATKAHRFNWRKIGQVSAFTGCILACVLGFASPPIALAAGMTLALTIDNPVHRLSHRAAQFLLKASVVLLGFSMDLAAVVRAGESGFLFAAVTIGGTLVLGWVTGVLLRISPKTSALISAGTAICGGSAIAAVGTVIEAGESDISVAMGTVFLLNAVALYSFPLVGHTLHLSQTQFGVWAGISIHDISSVVGAASRYGLTALQTATAVKLSRALWIVPVAMAAARIFASQNPAPQTRSRPITVPWFIGLFVVASILRTFVPAIQTYTPEIAQTAGIGLTLTLFLVGASITRRTLRTVGWRPMAQGIVLWACISSTSLFVITHFLK